jgi:hypothetical protein
MMQQMRGSSSKRNAGATRFRSLIRSLPGIA